MTARDFLHYCKKPVVVSFLVILVSTIIFILRNVYAFSMPNFYAEDATVVYEHIYSHPSSAFLTAFNGYLIAGVYLLGYIAIAIHSILGHGGLATLPAITALVSCVFLGVTASLPFLLFRKRLGVWLSLILVLLTALVPLYSSDYAIIGTLGNLKFAFLYIGFMLIIHRLYCADGTSRRTRVVLDVILFLCVLTNVTVAFLLPFLLIPYIKTLLQIVRTRKLPMDWPLISTIVLVVLAGAYVLIALIKGIPEIPGYLDGPFRLQALLPVIERTTSYAFSYPVTAAFNSYFVGALLCIGLAYAAWHFRKHVGDRQLLAVTAAALVLGTGLFVLNRPGIGDYYLNYGHKGGPDQFFYAQNMIMIFAVGWLASHIWSRFGVPQKALTSAMMVLYLILALPHGTSFGGSTVVYQDLKPIQFNLTKACSEYADKPKVIIQIYPTTYWQWQVERHRACGY